jgi:hypothetical protein
MQRCLLIAACMLLVSYATRTEAQVDCATIGQAELLHCDIPSDPSIATIAGLSVQRGGDYHCYRMPTIVITKSNGVRTVYNVSSSKWQYTNNNQNVQTTFTASNGLTGVQFVMNSTAGFSPLSGTATIGGQTVTFRTCGNQTTSAYYWTQSSQNPLEAFSCPVSRVPRGCPGVGYNP